MPHCEEKTAGGGHRSRARLACRRAAEDASLRAARREARAVAALVDTEVDLLRSAARPRRPRALPRVRAVALGRRAPVPPRARARARESWARRSRSEPHLRRDAGVPLQLVQLRLPAPAALRAARGADGAPGRRADRRVPGVRRRHGRADRRGQRRARVRDDLPVGVLAREAPRARLRAAGAGRHPERGRPGDLPSPDEPRSAGGEDGFGWSRAAGRTIPRKGAETLAWLDRNLDPTRFELTFAGRAPTPFEHVPRRRAARIERARRPAPDAGRVHRSEPRRSVLERAARSARVRPAGRVPRERRAPRARRRGGAARFGRTRSSATCSIASSSSSTSAGRRSRPRRSRRSRTATSRCSACAAAA